MDDYEITGTVPIPTHAPLSSRTMARRDPMPRPKRRMLDITAVSERRVQDLRLIVNTFRDQERLIRIAEAEAAEKAGEA